MNRRKFESGKKSETTIYAAKGSRGMEKAYEKKPLPYSFRFNAGCLGDRLSKQRDTIRSHAFGPGCVRFRSHTRGK